MNDISGNGNGHGVFGLQAKEDPIIYKFAPKARREVDFDNSLCFGARVLYGFLSDCSLWRGVNSGPGVVKFANSFLARKFDVDEKTVQNWKKALLDRGRIRVRERWQKNSYPTTVYVISALVTQETLASNDEFDDGSLLEDERDFSSNRKRAKFAQRDPDTGKWVKPGGGQKLLYPPESEQTVENVEPDAVFLPSAAATGCRPERQLVAVQSGKNLPSTAATGCRGGRQKTAAGDGNPLPLGTAEICRGGRHETADKDEVRGRSVEPVERGEAPRPPKKEPGGTRPEGNGDAFDTWRRSLATYFPSRLEKLESTIKARLATARSDTVKAGLRRQLEAVRETLLPTIKDPSPVRSPAPAPAKPAPPKIPLAKAKALLSAGLKAEGLRR